MSRKVVQVAMNGVTGRMGYRQHLVRSLLAIREQGGVPLADGTLVCPEPVLVGRREARLREIAEQHGMERWTTSLDDVLSDPGIELYFDTQVTSAREAALAPRHRGGQARVHREAGGQFAGRRGAAGPGGPRAGITHGVVQDKLFLPGMIKLRRLISEGFFGRVLSVRREFGYWVFEATGGRAAAVLELPQRGRRRHRAGHVPALAVRAGGAVRAGPAGVRAAGHASAGALGRAGTSLRRDRR